MLISNHNRYLAYYVNLAGYSDNDWHEYVALSPVDDEDFIAEFDQRKYNDLLRAARNGNELKPIGNKVPVAKEVIKDFKCVDRELYKMLEGRVRMKMRDLTVIVLEEV